MGWDGWAFVVGEELVVRLLGLLERGKGVERCMYCMYCRMDS